MSRLSWNQVRANAARFADEWQTACYEQGETQSFYDEFFEVFGDDRERVELLLSRCETLSAPLLAAAQSSRRKKEKQSVNLSL